MLNNESIPNLSDDSALEEYEKLLTDVFPEDHPPILGITDEVVIAPNKRALLSDPTTTLVSLKDGRNVIGVSVAIPIGRMDPDRKKETNTAYIYYTAIQPSRQGEGLVGQLMDKLFHQLSQHGYSYAERDSVIENGYADKVQKTYKEAIIESYDHSRFPEIGPERFFRIDINKALEIHSKV